MDNQDLNEKRPFVLGLWGVCFRNAKAVDPGGKQIQVENPDENPVERFEPGGR